jgi:hypothetical protein
LTLCVGAEDAPIVATLECIPGSRTFMIGLYIMPVRYPMIHPRTLAVAGERGLKSFFNARTEIHLFLDVRMVDGDGSGFCMKPVG